MEASSELIKEKINTISYHSKGIKKHILTLDHKPRTKVYNPVPEIRSKTILLNDILSKTNGTFKTGNILVSRMSPIHYPEGTKFKKVMRIFL